MDLGEIIKNYRIKHDLSLRDFSKRCDLSYTYISMLEKGSDYRNNKPLSPTLDAVNKIALGLNLSLDELLKLMDDQQINFKDKAPNYETSFNQSSSSTVVFIYGTIPAGIPMECIEDILDTEEISADMLKGGKQYFGLKIKGDSMSPEYLDNDTIILEKVVDCESGDDCVVMVNGNDGTFKRVFKNQNGIILQPLNNNRDSNGNLLYEPMIYSNEEIESLPIRILGKVVELRRKKK